MTVASLATTTQVVPSTRPMPVTIPAPGRIVVVQAGRGERAQLEERRARVEEALDPLADRELAALAMALDRALVAAGAAARDGRLARPKVGDERGHRVVVGARLGGGGVEPAAQDGHGPMIGRHPWRDAPVGDTLVLLWHSTL